MEHPGQQSVQPVSGGSRGRPGGRSAHRVGGHRRHLPKVLLTDEEVKTFLIDGWHILPGAHIGLPGGTAMSEAAGKRQRHPRLLGRAVCDTSPRGRDDAFCLTTAAAEVDPGPKIS
jgi:hypothetical protein